MNTQQGLSAPNAMPIFRTENLAYQREERNGYMSIIPAVHPEAGELLINAVTVQIMRLCNGENDFLKIIKGICDLYPQVPESQIRKDVFGSLGKLEHLSVITFAAGNPFQEQIKLEKKMSDSESFKHITENELKVIRDFIHPFFSDENGNAASSLGLYYVNPFYSKGEYDDVVLRQKLFSYAEEFFVATQNGKITACVSIKTLPRGDSVKLAEIGVIIASKDAPIKQLFAYAIETGLVLSIRDNVKVRTVLADNIPPALNELLMGNGFKEEARLADELGRGKDIIYWSRIITDSELQEIQKKRKEIGLILGK